MVISIIFIAVIIILGEVLTALFNKTRLPDVLPLMLLGIVIGPVAKLVTPGSFGATAEVFTTVALIVVLFQTGFELRISAVKTAWAPGLALGIAAFALGAAAIAVFAKYALGLGTVFAMITGVIAAENSFIITMPLLAKLNISHKSKTILLVESTIGSIICVVAVFALINIQKAGGMNVKEVLFDLFSSVLLAGLVGFVCAIFWSAMLEKIRRLQHSVSFTFAFVLLVYAICSLISVKGVMGVLVFSFVIGNIRVLNKFWLHKYEVKYEGFNDLERSFFKEIEFILKTLFFVYMGICISFENWLIIASGAAILALKLITRAPSVNYILPKSIVRNDCALALILCPSGLVSAVMAAMVAQELPDGGKNVEGIIYSLIFFSVVFTAVTSLLIEKGKLKGLYKLFFGRHPEGVVSSEEAAEPVNESQE
ncbi:Sodium/hydrogen exchanger family protein [Parelusimicrobium proximum]|uniref:cation:proton antiporter domain-containing protein n=1 Tax=Parelusimicrobium proximum TaxID=3228953 RepID=UPI003D178EED